MITFSYQARDAAGRIVSGVQEALNEDNAVTSLMSRGLMVLSLQRKATASQSRRKSTTVKETDLVLFTRQLSTMIEAGISLVQALTALYEQADPKRQRALRAVISDITARVQGGETFNESLAKHPRVFNRLFISMVKAGEHGGLLAEILDRLAGFLEASARLRKKVKSAMTYPVIVLCIAFAITTFLIVRVVPVFGEIFADFGAKLRRRHNFLSMSAILFVDNGYSSSSVLGARSSALALFCARLAANNSGIVGNSSSRFSARLFIRFACPALRVPSRN